MSDATVSNQFYVFELMLSEKTKFMLSISDLHLRINLPNRNRNTNFFRLFVRGFPKYYFVDLEYQMDNLLIYNICTRNSRNSCHIKQSKRI